MQRDLGSMSDHELLLELAQQGRKREQTERIKICVIALLLLTVIVLALIYIPKILAPIRQLNEKMNQIEETVNEAKRVLSGFDASTVEQFKQTMESLNETSQQARALMEKLKNSGIDKLQGTLEDFNNTLGTILQLFRR